MPCSTRSWSRCWRTRSPPSATRRPGLRAQLLSSLAVELQWTPQAERRMQLAQRGADARARVAGSRSRSHLVLTRSWALLDGSQPMVGPVRERLPPKPRQWRATTGDPAQLVGVLQVKAFMAAVRGDGAAFAAHFDEQKRIADGMRRPRLTWLTRCNASALAAYLGELDRAEQLANESHRARSARRPERRHDHRLLRHATCTRSAPRRAASAS